MGASPVAFVDPYLSLAVGDRLTSAAAASATPDGDSGEDFPGGAAGDGEADTASGGAPEEPGEQD